MNADDFLVRKQKWKVLDSLINGTPIWVTPSRQMAVDVDFALVRRLPLLMPREAAALTMLLRDGKRKDVAFVAFIARAIMLDLYMVESQDRYTARGLPKPTYFDERYPLKKGTHRHLAPPWTPQPEPLYSTHCLGQRVGDYSLLLAFAFYDERDWFAIALPKCNDIDADFIYQSDYIIQFCTRPYYFLELQKLGAEEAGSPTWLEQKAQKSVKRDRLVTYHPAMVDFYISLCNLEPLKEEDFVTAMTIGSVQMMSTVQRKFNISMDAVKIVHPQLMLYAKQKMVEKWRYLHSLGWDVTKADATHGFPLIRAAQMWDKEGIEFLLRLGVDPNVKSKRGMAAIHYLASSGGVGFKEEKGMYHNVSLLSILFRRSKHPVDVDATTDKGSTPLHVASSEEIWSYRSVETLLEYGANPRIKNMEGKYPYELFQSMRDHDRWDDESSDPPALWTDYDRLIEAYRKCGVDPPDPRTKEERGDS